MAPEEPRKRCVPTSTTCRDMPEQTAVAAGSQQVPCLRTAGVQMSAMVRSTARPWLYGPATDKERVHGQ